MSVAHGIVNQLDSATLPVEYLFYLKFTWRLIQVAWPETSFDTWQKFMLMTESLTIGSPAYLSYFYRGQADASWKLTPSMLRFLNGTADISVALEAERVALGEFRKQAVLHADTPVRSKIMDASLGDWWALMQHHNAPTRLFDWTRSPFVALYFACSSHFHMDGALWLFHVGDTATGMNEQFKTFTESRPTWESRYQDSAPPSGMEMFEPSPAIMTPRMVVQQGMFTVAYNPLEHHDDLIEPNLLPAHESRKGNETTFYKVVVPARLKTEFLRHLRSMNVTASSLFPGIDGLGRSISEMIALHTRSNPTSMA